MAMERARVDVPMSVGGKIERVQDTDAVLGVLHRASEADRTPGKNINTMYLDSIFDFTGTPSSGAQYIVRTIPEVIGSANPGATYVCDFHGLWKSTSGAGSMIGVTGQVEIEVESTNGSTGSMVGVSGEVFSHANTGVFARGDNLRAHSLIDGETGFTEMSGVNVLHEQLAGYTTQFFGLKAVTQVSGTGEMTTAYGVYLNIAGASTNWAFFSANTARSYFGGQAIFDQGIDVTGYTTAGVLGYDSALDGVRIQGKTGATYDLTFIAEAGGYVMRVPTGTNNLQIVGGLALDGGSNPVTYGANDSGGSGYRVVRVPNA